MDAVLATTEYAGNGKESPEYHNIVTWVRRISDRTVGLEPIAEE